MAEDSKNPNPRREKKPGPETGADLKSKVSYLPDVHRLLPQAPEMELGVLSAFVLAPREVGAMCVESLIKPAHFHLPAHAEVYAVLFELWDKNQPLDFLTITQALRDRNKLDAIGGAAFVSSLFTYLATASNAAFYIEHVQEKHVLREIIRVCNEYSRRSYDEQDEVTHLLDRVETEIFGITKDRFKEKAASMKDMVMKAIKDIESLYNRGGQVTGLATGFKQLDQMTDGLHAGEMFVIAARPSMGKTALAMNIAEHIAVNLKKPVAVFSLEMSAQQLVQRLVCSLGRVNLEEIRRGFMADRSFPALTAAAARLAPAPIFIDDSSSPSITELRAKARRMKAQHRDLACIFIDYLQLLRPSAQKKDANRQQEITEISAGVKALAKELGLPIVVLAQLNRNPETRTGESRGRPRISDLRESGSIEQDADVVALLVREEYYAENDEERESKRGLATLIIAKQRNGPIGDVPLTFMKEFTRFEDRADQAEPEI